MCRKPISQHSGIARSLLLIEEELTPEMQKVKEQAVQLFRTQRQEDLSEFNRDFLTPVGPANVHYTA